MDRTAWFARLALAVAILPHGVTKFSRTDDFMSKFDLSETVSYLSGIAELGGIAAILLGGYLICRGLRSLGLASTSLGLAGIATIQVGAITTVHWGEWWYYLRPVPGIEYNVVLLLLCAIVMIASFYERSHHEPTGRSLR